MDFQIAVDIEAAPDVVWSVMGDADGGMSGPRRCGASGGSIDHCASAAAQSSASREFPPAMWKVTALDPGRSFTWKSGAPGVRVQAHHSVTPTESGARATLRLHFDGVLGRLMGRMTREINNRYLGFEAAGLKRRSEALANAPAT